MEENQFSISEQQQQIKEWVKQSPKDLKKVLAQIKESWEITVSKDTFRGNRELLTGNSVSHGLQEFSPK